MTMRILALGLMVMMSACGGDGGSDAAIEPARSFAMGFTDFPHANSSAAVQDAFNVIAQDGDMAVMHFDDGIPWVEALEGVNTGTPYTVNYPSNYLGSIDTKLTMIPVGHVVYLAVTPLNFMRDRLAEFRGQNGSEPLTPPWDGYALDHPDVITAFVAHCRNMIDAFAPDYFAYGIEVNMLRATQPGLWPAFVNLAQAVYTQLKTDFPQLPIFHTLQASFYYADPLNQTTAINEILAYTDVIAVSAYPFIEEADPDQLPVDYFSAMGQLAPDKPFGVAETAWPAEPITDESDVVLIPADPDAQQRYIRRLLTDADTLEAEFVTLFFTRDFDEFWESYFKFLPEAPLARLWKDTGLYDGAGNPRPALDVWREYLN